MPKVSIITPAYNAEQWLAQTIKSALAQTFVDFEMIIVDDGSTDSTADVVRQFTDSRIQYIYQDNQGLAGARNTGIRASTGSFLAFLDADDLWQPDMLAETVSCLEGNADVAVVRTGHYYVDEDGTRMQNNPTWFPWEGNVFERLLINNVFVPVTTLACRECVNAAGLFDSTLAGYGNEDWDFWLRIAARGFQFAFISKPLAMYRRHQSNMSSNSEHMQMTRIYVLDKLYADPVLGGQVGHLKRQAYLNVYIRGCLEAFRSDLTDAALRDFSLAIAQDPAVLYDVAIYFQLACISVPIGDAPTSQNVDIERGRQYLDLLTGHIEKAPGHDIMRHRKQKAKGVAHLALGMVSYTHLSDMPAARSCFLMSIRYYPFAGAAWKWLARAIVGKAQVQRMRREFAK